MGAMSFFVSTTAAALLIASPSITDADRNAANGGFLVGNAQRCGIAIERVVRAGELVRELVAAASEDDKAQEAATARFAEFFLVSAFANPKKEKLVASCKTVSAELVRLEKHQVALVGTNTDEGKKSRPFGPGDGE
jgi:hypothetical protein